jgi:hypothetical protein
MEALEVEKGAVRKPFMKLCTPQFPKMGGITNGQMHDIRGARS